MAQDTYKGVPIIGDETPEREYMRTDVAYGYVPRDYSVDPPEMFEPPGDMKLIPESEWDARFDEQEELKSSLEHIYRKADNGKQPKNVYQNGDPFCWAHSTTQAVMMARAAANMPFEPLSAYMVACLAANYRVTGGWCGQSAKQVSDTGITTQKLWPQQSKSKSNDTPAMRADAAKRKITEEWRDLTRSVSGQSLTWQQVVSCGFNNQPMAVDYMWWSHSVCGVRPIRIEKGSWGLMILNSHGDNDGDHGFHILRGSKARPDGAIAIRSITAG